MDTPQPATSKESYPVLIGDIGGTNSRLCLIKLSSNIDTSPEVIDKKTLVSFDYESVEKLLVTYLADFKGTENYPVYAALGVPAPVSNNHLLQIVNLPHWKPSNGDEIAKRLGIKKLAFLNDFVCNGYGIQSKLEEGKDYIFLNKKKIDPEGPKAMIGPGTGLGMGYLVKNPLSNYYQVRPSEGGHQDFAPKTDLEFKYLKYLRRHYNVNHISIERACCGPALTAMYKFLLLHEKLEAEPTLKEKIDEITDTNNAEQLVEINKEIVQKGLKNECKVCRKVLKFFVDLFGNAAGNLAIFTLCSGGIYLLGGMSVALESVMIEKDRFMNAFIDKGRFTKMLKEIPIILIKETDLGMRGAQEYARQLIESQ